ncbi:MAG: adenosylcobinamide-GDP ribazoletransferase [Gammaproteobacteria bacterium]|nr:adenosylcobinamide-GDP ribazoletransferase [Gammaproteobacteria bacterium]MDH5802189.1 adenosylcobinamide-GDP ribazoletransferase [Gammaproteobacteria bacterium]
MRSFLVALQFLTRLPVPVKGNIEERHIRGSLPYYPLVGLILGVCLLPLYALFSALETDYNLSAAMVLTAWVFLSGALHLDGLADSADAWIGGLGDKQRTLDIMKDPTCGPAAVIALVLVLLLKFSALQILLAKDLWLWLLFTPMLARACIPVLFLTTPYARSSGLGHALTDPSPLPNWSVVIAVLALLIVTTLGTGVVAIFVTTLVFLLLRFLMLQRIHGSTGDTAGALIEWVEASVLIAVAAF